ncbi:inhibin alpha chain precursor [Silurus asotus]|uniref:Inhibin alpha chain n=1 Tax=Silurus asotus TaxID=30991 RepID=A0AAD5ABZ8_SILAS|nr:inhibin alpha chain precursor [Silurus asotus]
MNPLLIICALVFSTAWIGFHCQACQSALPQEVVLDWLKRRILEGLHVEKPPVLNQQSSPDLRVHVVAQHRAWRGRREAQLERTQHQEISQVILFPSSDSTCLDTSQASVTSEDSPSQYTYYFQPSLGSQESITSVDFWFYAGEAIAINTTSVSLYVLTTHQELIQLAQGPSKCSPDGWSTYRLERHFHSVIANGPFLLQVQCRVCSCYTSEEDKTPFLHVHVRTHEPVRARRAPNIAWSPAVIEKLQRPSTEKDDTYCRREQIEISFEELGWDNWIVHPKTFSFYYCYGNCSNPEFTATLLGMHQCCAPVPESMKSLRFTTTSDGGFSFKYETLPNIIPEECNCI